MSTEQQSADRKPLDARALEQWMTEKVANFRGPLTVHRLAGGQSNPTYKLSTPMRHFALRRKPFGTLLPGAHAIEREFKVLRALGSTAIPVPNVLALCDDPAVIGAAFYVMDFVDGEIFVDPRLLQRSAADRAKIFDGLNQLVANLHSVDYRAAGLADFGRGGNFMERQVALWSRQYRASQTQDIVAMDRLIEWLPAGIPPGEEIAIFHGDLRLDNVVFDRMDLRPIALLDWELSTLGHPLADFAYHVITWRLPNDLFRGLGDVDLAALGIPSEADYVAAYCRRTGRSGIENWTYFLVYGLFRLASILQGVAKRAADGNASDANAAVVGAKAKPVAELAWSLASGR